jgi:O-acetyl-ADP-ribose deacetylase (regulator of RNase III)
MPIHAELVDITTLAVDAIVNAANTALAPDGGVCGAIHHAAGPELAAACARVAPRPTGDARITPAFRLPCRYVIHAVGPIWRGGDDGEADLLASAYRSSLALARDRHLESVAFPAISTGIYGYPLDQAAPIALQAAKQYLEQHSEIELVRFVLWDAAALKAYERAEKDVFTSHE